MLDDELTATLESYLERWPDLDDAERMAAMAIALRVVVRVDKRCGALVVEDANGDVEARPAHVGFDWKFVVGAIITLVTTGIVPILIAHLAAGSHP